MRNGFSSLLMVTAVGLCGGCQQPLTGEEAQQALEESAVASQAAALVSASVEVSTDFTIGEAVGRAAEQIRDFVQTQLPCARITLQDATLSIEYGAQPGSCTFNGQRFEGTHTIQVERNDDADVVVQHTWEDFTNGDISVSGAATVTWSLEDRTRHIDHDLTWTRLSDGRTGTGSGSRTQAALDGGLSEGIVVDGTRSWEGESGRWKLTIDQVEMRWQDPVPQSGSWTLDTPFDKSLSLSFERIDEDRIAVTVSGPRRSVELRVSRLGTISRR
ncbi:MAG: hypothetical protein PVI30_11045 [Myxococcales bacterium]|jgi:hypothetical protein